MKSDEAISLQHLRWAVHMCQIPLDELGYLEDIKTKAYEFIRDANLQAPGRHFRALLPEAKIYVGQFTDDHIKEMCRVFKEGFSGLSEGTFIVSQSPTDAPVSFYVGAMTPEGRFFQSIVFHGDPVSQAAVALESHLVRSGLTGERIRKCAECDIIFVTERKGQIYCSTACSRTVANRDYYKREKLASVKPAATAKRRAPARKKSRKK